jgi:3-hydroxybutyryl-CoA dehydrogenase
MTTANLSQTVVVIGTGTMAAGIAAGFLEVRMPLVVLGRSIEKAQATLEQALKLAQTLGAKAPSDVPQEVGLINDWNNWTSVAWVIETVTVMRISTCKSLK